MLQADAAQRLAAQVTEVMGGCDILVISASLQVHKPLLDMPTADTERQLRLNILTTVDLLQALVPAMQANRRGRILAIGSVPQAAPSPEMPIYAATKAAGASIVKTLAIDLAPYGVTINSLAASSRPTGTLSAAATPRTGSATSARPIRWAAPASRPTWSARRCSAAATPLPS